MTKTHIQKLIKLSNEFDSYMVNNPRARRRVPSGAHIVLTSSKETALSEASLSIARNSKTQKFIVAHNANGRWYMKDFKK